MVDKTEIPLSNISNLTQLAVAASVMLLFLAFGSPNNPVELTTTAAPTTTATPTTTTKEPTTTQKPLPTLNPMPSSSPSNNLMFEKTHLDDGNITWDLFANIGINSKLLAVYGEYNNPLFFQSNETSQKIKLSI